MFFKPQLIKNRGCLQFFKHPIGTTYTPSLSRQKRMAKHAVSQLCRLRMLSVPFTMRKCATYDA